MIRFSNKSSEFSE